MVEEDTLEIPIQGMDCAECTIHVQKAIDDLPGVQSAHVFLVTEKALVRYDPNLVSLSSIRGAVEGAGYSVPESGAEPQEDSGLGDFTRPVLAAAAQSLPDLGILANSSRLLRQGGGEPVENLRGSS